MFSFTRAARAARHFSSSSIQPNRRRSILKYLVWGSTGGYVTYSYLNYRDAVKKESVYDIPAWKLALYRFIPLSTMTLIAGHFASCQIPTWLRKPLYGTYSWLYGCDLDECAPLASYPTFNHFFTRPLLPGNRPVDSSCLVSPADGKVLAFGCLPNDNDNTLFPEQVKGVRYPLSALLRRPNSESGLGTKKNIYYCSVYLAPGSYHRFHCPINKFRINRVDRIAGEVLPVAPWVMRLIPGLVSLNERVVMEGRWDHGKMYIVPVGATNVRSVTLSDNVTVGGGVRKGDELGQFEMGSLVLMIFEGPSNLEWTVKEDQPIKYGQSMGSFKSSSWWPW